MKRLAKDLDRLILREPAGSRRDQSPQIAVMTAAITVLLALIESSSLSYIPFFSVLRLSRLFRLDRSATANLHRHFWFRRRLARELEKSIWDKPIYAQRDLAEPEVSFGISGKRNLDVENLRQTMHCLKRMVVRHIKED